MRHYYGTYVNITNTCKIKFLHKAHIGNGVRITSDKNTVEFDNKPMTGLKIEDYNKQGFRISHSNLPKAVWVDFDQLPLTRLTIKNGIIEDEITFVENIVNHRMQLIRTLDTEYIDLIFKEKELQEKKDKIIPITSAIPGQLYVGAQCEEGNEMIFLGLFYIKSIKSERNYWNRSDVQKKIYFSKLTPQRAFFVVPHKQLSQKEDDEIELKYFPSGNRLHFGNMSWEERDRLRKLCDEEKNEKLKNSPITRYKLLDFAITSKRIKNVILTNKENKHFENEILNRESIMYLLNIDTDYSEPKVDYKLVNRWYDDFSFISKIKETIEKETKEHYLTYYNIKIEEKYYEERYN